MLVVFPSRPGVVEAADSRTQGMAVSSTVTLASAWPTTLLPSLACHVGPAKWVMMSLPWSSKRFARGTAELQAVPLHELIWTFFFFNDTATTEIYTLSLHDALPI